MIANATQLLVTLACGLPKPFCYSLTRRSFSLWLFLLSLLLTLLSSPTIPAGTLPPHSIKSVSPPHTDTTLLSSSSPPSLLSILSCHGGEIEKKLSLLYTSPYQSFPLLRRFPAVGSPQTHTRTHTCPWRGGGQPLAVGCCMVEQACFFLLLTARHAVACSVGPQKSRVRCRAVGGSQWGEGKRWRGAVWRRKRTAGIRGG